MVKAEDATALRVQLLGPVQAWYGPQELAVGPPRRRAMLAMLALRANRTVSRDELVDGVWGTDPPTSVVNRVHVHVGALRQVLEPDRARRAPGRVLVSTTSGYRLALDPDHLDVDRFGTQVAQARRLSAGGEVDAAVSAYGSALALWSGPPLAAVPGPSADTERVRLEELRLAAAEERAEAMLVCGQPSTAVTELVALVAEHPLRERLRALLMMALCRSGRPAEALTVFAETRRLLSEALGTEPGPELRQLHHDLLRDCDTRAADRVGPGDVTLAGDEIAETGGIRVVPRQLPPVVRHFAGRQAELAALADLADQAAGGRGPATIVVIHGTAGVGKTSLALHWAHQVASRFPDGQLYVNLRGFASTAAPTQTAEAVRGFLDAFGAPERIPGTLDGQAALLRSLIAGRRMLMVLDNAGTVDQVRPLLPGGSGALVVVTSRDELRGLVVAEGAHTVPLEVLPAPDAWALLVGRLGAPRVAAEPEAVDDLVDMCARLPLALAVVAGRAVTHRGFSLRTLAAELREARGGLEAFSGPDDTTDIRGVFSWSFRRLSGEAARLFRLLGLHPGPDVGLAGAVSLAGRPEEVVRRALAELCRAHLVSEHRPGRYTFHDLLRAYAGELARTDETEDERRAAVHRLLDHYVHSSHAANVMLEPHRHPVVPVPCSPGVIAEAPPDASAALDWFTTEHAVLLGAIDLAGGAGFDSHVWQFAWNLAEYLDRRGHWHDLGVTAQAALDAAGRLGDQRAQARARRGLARACNLQGNDDRAWEHLERALSLYRRLGDRLGQGYTHHNLSSVAECQRRYVAGLWHAHRSLWQFQAAGHLAWQARALNAVAWFLVHLEEPRQALIYGARALRIFADVDDPTGEASTWDTVGAAHRDLGNHQEAIACCRYGLRMLPRINNRYYEGNVTEHLGDAYAAAGDHRAAIDAWRHALEILDELGHADARQVRAKLDRAGFG
jgi:DNA-binding SARP family transcriptional activator/tetratricopeptide (TPR) repeat protein